jgi:carbon storage regulator
VLVLSRKADQSVMLGTDITITVLSIDGDRIKLGIQAPRSVSVLRQELFNQLQASNAAASAAPEGLRRIAAALHERPAEVTAAAG